MDVVDSFPVLVGGGMPGRQGKYTGGQVTNFSPVLVDTISTSCLEEANCGHTLHLSDVITYFISFCSCLTDVYIIYSILASCMHKSKQYYCTFGDKIERQNQLMAS